MTLGGISFLAPADAWRLPGVCVPMQPQLGDGMQDVASAVENLHDKQCSMPGAPVQFHCKRLKIFLQRD